MSSLVLWRDPETGVEACWNKQAPYSVQHASLVAPRTYHSDTSAVRAAKRLAAKIRKGKVK